MSPKQLSYDAPRVDVSCMYPSSSRLPFSRIALKRLWHITITPYPAFLISAKYFLIIVAAISIPALYPPYAALILLHFFCGFSALYLRTTSASKIGTSSSAVSKQTISILCSFPFVVKSHSLNSIRSLYVSTCVIFISKQESPHSNPHSINAPLSRSPSYFTLITSLKSVDLPHFFTERR